MFYLDSQLTITRRDSSLIVPKRTYNDQSDIDVLSTERIQSTGRLVSESSISVLTARPHGATRKELVTMMFESMLGCIVESWDVIEPPKLEPCEEFDKTPSDSTIPKKKTKQTSANKTRSAKSRSRSKISTDPLQIDLFQQCWWSSPDERAVIRFKNGNVYEGNISMKCMHGEGRYQWANGTVYLGNFHENVICGKGLLHWKDDCWYEGDFSGNLRCGKGLYVDPRRQRSYAGGWLSGCKHGDGVIFYDGMRNSYDGQWVHNVRHGFGSREYSPDSGYNGEWDTYVREGNGLMIWPNHDFYRGHWKNGVMSDYGIYIWNAYYNNTLSLPSVNYYRGQWQRGQRNGPGALGLGLGLGSRYVGEIKGNKKHGAGKFISNNGLIIQGNKLFIDDNIVHLREESTEDLLPNDKHKLIQEPYLFDICDTSVGMIYHVEQALKNIDRQDEIRAQMIAEYFEYNKSSKQNKIENYVQTDQVTHSIEDVIKFEETSLNKATNCYRVDLKNIYYTYATICNTEEISFTPILIRLYLWQFYYDCNMHEKGLTLVEIDRLYYENPKWLSKSPHNPFEKIFFWQFTHSLISVASRLYAKKEMPGTKPDTILASAFRSFMEIDVLPNVGKRKGSLARGFATIIPLIGTYQLYRSLGEPHTVRTFLRAVRSPLCTSKHVNLVEIPDETIMLGRNAYVFGDELTFITDDVPCTPEDDEYIKSIDISKEYKLFNFANLSIRSIINIFSNIFPQVIKDNEIMDLEVEITFLEFFEAFVACSEESIRVRDEELKWKAKFSMDNTPQTSPEPTLGMTASTAFSSKNK